MEERIFSEVQLILADLTQIDMGKIKLDSSLRDDLGIDSLIGAEIAMSVEDKYQLQVSDDDLLEFHTVQDIISFVQAKLTK